MTLPALIVRINKFERINKTSLTPSPMLFTRRKWDPIFFFCIVVKPVRGKQQSSKSKGRTKEIWLPNLCSCSGTCSHFQL